MAEGLRRLPGLGVPARGPAPGRRRDGVRAAVQAAEDLTVRDRAGCHRADRPAAQGASRPGPRRRAAHYRVASGTPPQDHGLGRVDRIRNPLVSAARLMLVDQRGTFLVVPHPCHQVPRRCSPRTDCPCAADRERADQRPRSMPPRTASLTSERTHEVTTLDPGGLYGHSGQNPRARPKPARTGRGPSPARCGQSRYSSRVQQRPSRSKHELPQHLRELGQRRTAQHHR